MSPKRTTPEEIEEERYYIEEILAPDIITAQGKQKTIPINPLVSICFPGESVEIQKIPEESKVILKQGVRSLSLWLDPEDDKSIGIGDHDYLINREGKLIELAQGGIFLSRKPGSQDYLLTKDEEDRFVINLRVIENEKIASFFE